MFKLVRNKVPELFERHHGYAPEEVEESQVTVESTRKWIVRAKLEEELGEFIEAAFDDNTDIDAIFEEAADLYEAITQMLKEVDEGSGYTEEKLGKTIRDKRAKYGSFSDFRFVRISEEEKEHYYNNIKGKVDNEY